LENKKREAVVDDLSHDGRGVLKLDGKVYFVPGALPGERIEFEPFRKRRGQFTGRLLSVLSASPHRVQPACEYFGTCGGCTLQHLAPDQQLAYKEKTLLGNLSRIGRVKPENLLPALSGENWHYRRKARPGVKYVPKKGGVLVGFREQGNSYLTSLRQCIYSTLCTRSSRRQAASSRFRN
jgi:23S rRNA (uracil1939-C5)-methyltransferase